MTVLDTVRTGLEAAVAAEFGFLAAYLLLTPYRRERPAVLVALLGITLVLIMGFNAISSIALALPLRLANVPLELTVPPLVFLIVRQLARPASAMPRWTVLLLLFPAAGSALAGAGLYGLIAPHALIVIAGFTVAAGAYFRARQIDYASAPARLMARGLIVWLGLFGLLRAIIEIEAAGGGSYRASIAYVAVLAAALIASFLILYLCLRTPDLLAVRKARYSTSYLTSPDIEHMGSRLLALLEADKIYRDPALSLAGAAARVGATERELSQVVNSTLGGNFSAVVNRMRINEAAERLQREHDVPITRIMFEAGFGSKSTFLREFSRHFGTSPSKYRRSATGP